MGSGVISFGLVNIPVKVYSANDSSGKISFNQLHSEKRTRLKQQMYDPETGEIVPRDKIIKGYEFAKDQYIVFAEDELDQLELATSRSMDITEFVPIETVDPLFYESGYYLGPDKGAERAFKLLTAGMADMKHAAIAKYVRSGKQNLILLRPYGPGIVMQMLRFADELKEQGDVPIPEATISDAELGLARQFIQQLAKPKFDPTQYKDEYREKLKDLIERKVKGETVTLTPVAAPVPKVVDLMEALKASLAKQAGAPAPVAASAAPAADERKPPHRAPRSEDAAKEAPAPKKARERSRR